MEIGSTKNVTKKNKQTNKNPIAKMETVKCWFTHDGDLLLERVLKAYFEYFLLPKTYVLIRFKVVFRQT